MSLLHDYLVAACRSHKQQQQLQHVNTASLNFRTNIEACSPCYHLCEVNLIVQTHPRYWRCP